jgi:hypothetical protein
MGLSPQEAVERAIGKADLSETTKKNYLLQFRNLVRLAGGSAVTVFRSPEKVYAAICAEYPSPLTRRALLSVARALVAHLPAVKRDFPSASDAYAEFLKTDRGIAGEKQRLLDGQLSERERTTFVQWDEILRVRDEAEREDPDSASTLLISMYTLMEPVRQDFGHVRISYKGCSEPEDDNFCVLDKKDRSSGSLVLAKYKTAKSYGEFRRDLPEPLVELIWKTLDARPRDYLFAGVDGGPMSKGAYTKWSIRTLERLFDGRRVTVNVLRHSFISGMDFNKKTPGEILAASKMMGHSAGQQQMYRRLPSDEAMDETSPPRVTPAPPAARAPAPLPKPAPARKTQRIVVEQAPNRTPPTAPQPTGARGRSFISLMI